MKIKEIFAYVVFEPTGQQTLFAFAPAEGMKPMQAAFSDINLAKAVQPMIEQIAEQFGKEIACRKFTVDETWVLNG